MLTLYARYRDEELRALQAHCLNFCYYQYDKGALYFGRCANCEKRRICKDLTNLAHHCETLINSCKSVHC